MKKYSLSALVAAGVLAGGMATSASAADLGGNCCADLEERIADLESTTARKGNRKVSLTISGWVSQQLIFWNDGVESNVYITDVGTVSIGSHVKFSGQATIAPGWAAGYVLNLEAVQNDSLLVDQNNDNGIAPSALAAVAGGGAGAIGIESSYWFVKSDQLGRVSLGKQSSAADNQAIIVDGSGSLVVANYVLYDSNAFFLRNSDASGGALSGLRFGGIASCAPLDGGGGVSGDCDGYISNNIRYDSPVFAGFSASYSWGEDDQWAVSGRYSGEGSGFKLNLAVAYNESTDENGPGGLAPHLNLQAQAIQFGGYLEHVATGLFVYGAYSKEFIDTLVPIINGVAFDASAKPEGDQFYIKGGIRQKWNPLGHTVIFGEYQSAQDRQDATTFLAGVTASDFQQYGVGAVQEVDAAAMSLWIGYRHYSADLTCGAAGTVCGLGNNTLGINGTIQDFDLVKAGALINF